MTINVTQELIGIQIYSQQPIILDELFDDDFVFIDPYELLEEQRKMQDKEFIFYRDSLHVKGILFDPEATGSAWYSVFYVDSTSLEYHSKLLLNKPIEIIEIEEIAVTTRDRDTEEIENGRVAGSKGELV